MPIGFKNDTVRYKGYEDSSGAKARGKPIGYRCCSMEVRDGSVSAWDSIALRKEKRLGR